VGEIASEERGLVPAKYPGPSSHFLAQLATFSAPFRLARTGLKPHKSF